MNFWDRAERTDTFLSLAERLGEFFKFIGEKGITVAAVLAAVGGFVAWFRDHVPWWTGIIIVATLFSLGLFIYHQFQLIRVTSTFDKKRYLECAEVARKSTPAQI